LTQFRASQLKKERDSTSTLGLVRSSHVILVLILNLQIDCRVNFPSPILTQRQRKTKFKLAFAYSSASLKRTREYMHVKADNDRPSTATHKDCQMVRKAADRRRQGAR